MRAIFDEGVPKRLVRDLRTAGVDVAPFPNAWKGMKNGALLAIVAQHGFNCLITCDRNMRFQQNLAERGMALIVLPSQKLAVLQQALTQISEAVLVAAPGEVHVVPAMPGD